MVVKTKGGRQEKLNTKTDDREEREAQTDEQAKKMSKSI
jgi:hypothetical protein